MKMTRGTLIQALKVAQSMETEFAVTVGLTELSDRGWDRSPESDIE